jgi:hypothetical protein
MVVDKEEALKSLYYLGGWIKRQVPWQELLIIIRHTNTCIAVIPSDRLVLNSQNRTGLISDKPSLGRHARFRIWINVRRLSSGSPTGVHIKYLNS